MPDNTITLVAGETRVAATPATVAQLLKLGYDVVVEPDAGVLSSFTDEAYVEAGARVGSIAEADIVLGVNAPSTAQLDALKPGTTLVAILNARERGGMRGLEYRASARAAPSASRSVAESRFLSAQA